MSSIEFPSKKRLVTNRETFALLHQVRRFCGFTPFYLYHADKNSPLMSVKITIKDALCFVTCCVIYTYFSMQNYHYRILFAMSRSFLSNMGNILITFCGVLMAAGCPIMNIINRKKICKMFNMVEEWDVNLYYDLNETLDMVPIKKRLYIYMLYGFGSTFFNATSSIFMFLYITDFNFFKEWYFLLCYFIVCLAYFVFISHFIIWLQVICNRFHVLNVVLEKRTNSQVMKKQTSEELENSIIKISILHNEVSEILELGNRLFSVQMIPFFTTFMCYLIFVAFQGYLLFFDYNTEDLIKTLMNVLWLVWLIVLVVIIVHNASKILELSEDMAIKVHNTINQLDPRNYCSVVRRMRYFVQQIQHRKPVVSCGLFVIDYSLLLGMSSAFITFIVILIQFETVKNI
ncbi:putative gustatory receptor 28b [Culicoides brevitarsis]|uniref:putative gustatory receptor 28b n=1 Tax=Culicoides brevitarsis TaxID=469753 RepID=UPI00307B6C30